MKNKIIAISIMAAALAIVMPVHAQIGVTDTFHCPPIVGWPDNVKYPAVTDNYQRLSPDGKMLAYNINDGDAGAYVLNLQSLHRTALVGNAGLPGEYDDWWGYWTWCPYDSDIIAFDVDMWIDDTSGGHSDLNTGHIFTESISTGESQLISPEAGGPFRGATLAHSSYYTNKPNWDWLTGSNSGLDSFVIKFYYPGMSLPDGFYGLYVPQTQTMIQWPRPDDDTTGVLRYSHDKRDSIRSHAAGICDPTYFLDERQIKFPFAIDSCDVPVHWASFSPNDSLFALVVYPIGMAQLIPDTNDNPLVLIYKVSDPSNPIYTLNFQKLFCRYGEDCPEFVTDSTIVVSMYTDGDDYAPLFEITINGRMVRQLTYLSQSSVPLAKPSDVSVSVDANPFANISSVTVILNSPDRVDVEVSDILGRMVYRNSTGQLLEVGVHHIPIDLSQSPAGTYYLRVRLGTGEVQTVKIVKE